MFKNKSIIRNFLLIFSSLIMINASSQTGINFQGVARTSNNVILASQPITVRFSILQGSVTGTAEYVETRRITTNAQGLFTAVIGDVGTTSKIGTFASINWKSIPKFLKIEMDPTAGINFISMGTIQFQYVPYAQFANSVDAQNISGVVPVTLGGTGVNNLTSLKSTLLLDKVNNTSDAEKPISTLTQNALNLKFNATDTNRFLKNIDTIRFLKSADTIKFIKKTYIDSALLTKLSTTGNAATATKLATARKINGVSFDGSADITLSSTSAADASTLSGTSLNATVTGSSLTSVGTLTNLNVTNPINGSITGNAATATKLATARTINGVSFDGSANITLSTSSEVDAGTLTGSTLNPTIINSSLTSVGRLMSATVRGKVIVGALSETSASSVLEANSTTQGFLPPRMTYAQRVAIVSPAAGLTIWCINCGTSGQMQVYNGTAWTNMIGDPSLGTAPIVASTTIPTNITITTATSGGNITSDGGATITAFGVCWGTSANPTIANSKTTQTGSTGAFTSNITGLTGNTLYYIRAYATNSSGTTYGPQISFNSASLGPTVASTSVITNITATSATSGGNVTSDGGATITARGLCWNTSPNPTIANTKTNEQGTTGAFTSNVSGLTGNTLYYVRAYATNSNGTNYGPEVSFRTAYATVTSSTNKIWMDRNLGATQVATSLTDNNAYGDLYQWGRLADGHQLRNSVADIYISSTDVPLDATFIKSSTFYYYDWRSPQKDALWQGVSGINNPCPTGFRLPTEAEFTAEMATWSSQNAAGAFGSPLKLPNGGFRDYGNGNISAQVGSYGYYWTSSINGPSGSFTGQNAKYLVFNSVRTAIEVLPRAAGLSVRCIKN